MTKSRTKPFLEKISAARFLTCSIGIHLLLVIVVGGAVIFKVVPPISSFVAEVGNSGFIVDDQLEVLETTEESLPELEEQTNSDSPQDSPSMSSPASAITSLVTTASFSVQSKGAEQMLGNTLSGDRMLSSSLGAGTSKGSSAAKGVGLSAKLFGMPVQAKKLGVILDISLSTHEVIDIAIDEIQGGFPDALIVLVPGCGMSSVVKGEVMPAAQFQRDIKDYELPGIKLQMSSFLPKLIETNKGFERLWRKGNRDKRLFALALTTKDPQTAHASITGTQHAFEFLMREEVDAIYWMADYQDHIEPKLIEALGTQLKDRQIVVYQHDLDSKPQPPVRISLSKTTGGQFIQGDPKELRKK